MVRSHITCKCKPIHRFTPLNTLAFNSNCFFDNPSCHMSFAKMWYVHQQRLRPACSYRFSDQSLCWSLKCSLTVKLLSEQHLEFLNLKGGITGSSESTLVKVPHCWKSHVPAHFICNSLLSGLLYMNIYHRASLA